MRGTLPRLYTITSLEEGWDLFLRSLLEVVRLRKNSIFMGSSSSETGSLTLVNLRE